MRPVDTPRPLVMAVCLLVVFCSSSASARRHRRHRHVADPEPAGNPSPVPTTPPAWPTIDHVEETTIYFHAPAGSPTPKPLQLGLYDIKALGTLRPLENGQPYFVISARACKDCQQEPGLYAIQATPGKPIAFVYPGKIYEHKSRALALDSRAFFGQCLKRSTGDVLVIFQREKVDRRHGMLSSVLIAEPVVERGASGDAIVNHLHEQLIERRLPRIRDTLRRVKANACFEIEGRDRLTLRRPLDINLRQQKAGDADDEDSDDAPKENQTDRDISTQ